MAQGLVAGLTAETRVQFQATARGFLCITSGMLHKALVI